MPAPTKQELLSIINSDATAEQKARAQALLSDSPSKSGSSDGGATARLLIPILKKQLALPHLEKSWRENLLKQKALREGEL